MLTSFDGHNDLLLNLWLNYQHTPEKFFTTRIEGHLDYSRILRGGLGGGLFAIFVPPHHYIAGKYPEHARQLEDPLAVMWEQLRLLEQLERLSGGKARICFNAAQIRQCLDNAIFAMVAHIEGADALDPEGILLEKFYQSGVRSVGPFWNNPNRFGEGVCGSFPGSPDTGLGLTPEGRRFIKQLMQRKMVIDVSHMNERTFWETCELVDQPLVATHSSVHRLCAQPRNLTDDQLLAIKQSGGMVGINFGNGFIRPDGQRNPQTSVACLADHILYLLDYLGEDYVGFGSDFDGVLIPDPVKDVSGLPLLINELAIRGVPEGTLSKVCCGNWLSVLDRIWGE